MEKIESVIFDLYGTLIEVTDIINPYKKMFFEYCRNGTTSRIARKFALIKDFKDLKDLMDTLKPGNDFNTKLYENLLTEELKSVKPYDETFEVLERLKERDVKVGLISNLASSYKKPFFELGLDQYFDSMIFSSDVGFRKPDNQIYELAIKELNTIPNRILMVGDHRVNDYEKPKGLGMNALHLDRNKNDREKGTIYSLNEVLDIQ